MKIPKIERIEDILKYIEYPWLKVKENKDIITINYCNFAYVNEETDIPMFPNEYTLECRGIKFNKDGKILARPFQKFFNLGEVEGDLNNRSIEDARIFEKLDGSMIHPIIINNKVRLCTRAGITEVSTLAENTTCFSNIKESLLEMLEEGFTPIFEFTSPENRIVLKYNEALLTLLAVRNTVTGEYEKDLKSAGKKLNVPVVKEYSQIDIENLRKETDKEGIVLIWNDSFHLKVKTEEYVFRHKAKDAISLEKNRIEIILSDKLDDFKSIISQEDYEYLIQYRNHLLKNIHNFKLILIQLWEHIEKNKITRKEIGLDSKYSPIEKMCIFFLFNNPSMEVLEKRLYREILKRISSKKRLNEIREVIGSDLRS